LTNADAPGKAAPVARKILWASLLLTPLVFVLKWATSVGDVALFAVAALALVPLAWLIGEATEHAGEHTGPGVGGFLNATFGNAPELIIALLAINSGLPNVVRGSLMGSVASNILLVLGAALAFGRDARIDRRSLLLQLGLVIGATLAFLIPSIPSWHGDPERHSLAVLTVPVAVVLLLVYAGVITRNLRRHHRQYVESEQEPAEGWSLPRSLFALALATVATAFVSEVLVHALDHFAHAAHLSEFFISAVVVAIVGNAAEHGGAVVIARRGKMRLATEIAISSSAQVAMLVIPAIALLSFLVSPPLPLSFRPIELFAMGASALFVAIVIRDGRVRRWEGAMLIAVYCALVVAFALAGDR
jgi:Ca2+:H+ antiporter